MSRKGSPKPTEAELAQSAMEFLELWGFECYPEVAPWGAGEPRCDIVAVRDPIVMAVEIKTRMCTDVLTQACRWIGMADYVVAMAPSTPMFHDSVLRFYATHHGIGMISIPINLEVDALKKGWSNVWGGLCGYSGVPPRKQRRKRGKTLRDYLHEDQKRYSPGTQGGFSTPWSRTMDRAVEIIKKIPGLPIKDIVDKVDHHYQRDTTARSSIPIWLDRDPRVESRHEALEGVMAKRYYPAEGS